VLQSNGFFCVFTFQLNANPGNPVSCEDAYLKPGMKVASHSLDLLSTEMPILHWQPWKLTTAGLHMYSTGFVYSYICKGFSRA
jgi:hypothetical protein